MPTGILLGLADRMNAHPWWRHRHRLVASLLHRHGVTRGARVLDAGCGPGLTLERLEVWGYTVVGLDAVRPLLEELDAPTRLLFHADLTRRLPAALGLFDAVLLLDVIEHLDDECASLAAVRPHLQPNGLLVVTVPARRDLYSDFDRAQGHRRRYSPGSLRAVLEGTGYRMERCLWWGGWMVPVSRFRRRRSQAGASNHRHYERLLRLPPRGLRWVLEGFFRADHHWTLLGLNWTGTSLVALARPSP